MHAAGPDSPPGPLSPSAVALTIHPKLPADWPASGLGDPGRLARELPDPSSLPPSSWVAITSGAARAPGLWARLRGHPFPTLHLAVRCTALLLRGYVNVRADQAGRALGQVPRPA